MEVENQFFGNDAGNVEKNDNLKSEDFKFYHQNKEEAKKNIEISSQELTDFISSLIKDMPDPSQEQVDAGIEKILKATHPEDNAGNTVKESKTKKVTLKVLFVAAVLFVLFTTCLFAVGNSRDINIENGFVTFAKDTVKIVFFGETEQEYVSFDVLLEDLKKHGYTDIMLPKVFTESTGNYKASVPEYSTDGASKDVLFELKDEKNTYVFYMCKADFSGEAIAFKNIDNAETVVSNGVYIYVFDFGESSAIEFNNDEIYYNIKSEGTFSDMVKIAESIE